MKQQKETDSVAQGHCHRRLYAAAGVDRRRIN